MCGDFNCYINNPIPRNPSDDVHLESTTAAGLVQTCGPPTYTAHFGELKFPDLVFAYDLFCIQSAAVCEGLHGSDHLNVERLYAVSLPRTGH